jgi:hypothetical protein
LGNWNVAGEGLQQLDPDFDRGVFGGPFCLDCSELTVVRSWEAFYHWTNSFVSDEYLPVHRAAYAGYLKQLY